MAKIHSTAIVSAKAQLAADVEIGPHCVIGDGVVIGAKTRLLNQVTLQGNTHLGQRNLIYTGTCLGYPGQIRNPASDASHVVIGDDNIFREFVTVHGSAHAEKPTRIGSRGFFMANAHIAHDCVVGDDVTMANIATLGGHVTVGDHSFIGGLVGVHQNVRIGQFAMIGGCSKPVMDIPPFSLCDGIPARIFGVNVVGLKRAGYTVQQVRTLKQAMRLLLASGQLMKDALLQAESQFKDSKDVRHLIQFIRDSKRGVLQFDSSSAKDTD